MVLAMTCAGVFVQLVRGFCRYCCGRADRAARDADAQNQRNLQDNVLRRGHEQHLLLLQAQENQRNVNVYLERLSNELRNFRFAVVDLADRMNSPASAVLPRPSVQRAGSSSSPSLGLRRFLQSVRPVSTASTVSSSSTLETVTGLVNEGASAAGLATAAATLDKMDEISLAEPLTPEAKSGCGELEASPEKLDAASALQKPSTPRSRRSFLPKVVGNVGRVARAVQEFTMQELHPRGGSGSAGKQRIVQRVEEEDDSC